MSKIRQLEEMAVARMKRREEMRQRAEQEAARRFDEVYNRADAEAFRQAVDELNELRFQLLRSIGRRVNGRDGEKAHQERVALLRRAQELNAIKLAELERMGYPPDYLEVKYQCPQCKDMGFLPPTYITDEKGERAVLGGKCECLKQEELEDLYILSGIQEQMREWTFEHFDPELFTSESRPGMQKLVEECRTFAEDYLHGKQVRPLMLLGEVGRGKTYLATAIANHLLRNYKSVAFLKENELMRMARRRELMMEDEENTILLNKLLEADLLIVDDLGTMAKETAEGTYAVSEFTKAVLLEVLEARLNSGKPFVITTNLDLDDINKTYGERITSRVIGFCRIKRVLGEKDLRRQIKEREMRGRILQPVGSSALKEDWTFQNMRMDLYRGDAGKQMRALAEDCRAWIENVIRGESVTHTVYLISGPEGTGKSFLASCMANAMLDNHQNVAYLHAIDIRLLKEERSFLDILMTAPLFVLDALGEEKPTPFVKETLHSILKARVSKHLPTIITTELNKDELVETYGEWMAKLLGYKRVRWRVAFGENIRELLRQEQEREDE